MSELPLTALSYDRRVTLIKLWLLFGLNRLLGPHWRAETAGATTKLVNVSTGKATGTYHAFFVRGVKILGRVGAREHAVLEKKRVLFKSKWRLVPAPPLPKQSEWVKKSRAAAPAAASSVRHARSSLEPKTSGDLLVFIVVRAMVLGIINWFLQKRHTAKQLN